MNDDRTVEALDLHIDLCAPPEGWYVWAEEEMRFAVTGRILSAALAELQDLCSVFAGTDEDWPARWAHYEGDTEDGWNWHEKLDAILKLLSDAKQCASGEVGARK